MKTTYRFSSYNTDLFGQYWRPPICKAVLVLVHGMGEHSGRYETSLVPPLLDAEYAVVTFDLFGHGQSSGKRGHCPSYEALLDAIDTILVKTRTWFPEIPVLLYGHSLGGNLVINYTVQRQPDIQGLIASSPFLRLAFNPPKWKLVIGKLLLNLLPTITLPSELEVEAISRIEEEVQRYREDPLIHDRISPVYSFPVMEQGEWAIEHAGKLQVPALVLHGTGDRIIDHTGSVAFCDRAASAELKLFEGGYHELHHDLCREEFVQSILNWLNNL